MLAQGISPAGFSLATGSWEMGLWPEEVRTVSSGVGGLDTRKWEVRAVGAARGLGIFWMGRLQYHTSWPSPFAKEKWRCRQGKGCVRSTRSSRSRLGEQPLSFLGPLLGALEVLGLQASSLLLWIKYPRPLLEFPLTQCRWSGQVQGSALTSSSHGGDQGRPSRLFFFSQDFESWVNQEQNREVWAHSFWSLPVPGETELSGSVGVWHCLCQACLSPGFPGLHQFWELSNVLPENSI